jgi:hypothetical protein
MSEDLQRQPDGIPHAVIGLTALFCVYFAMLLVAILLTGTSISTIAAVALVLVALPVAALGLQRMAARQRDHDHPSI